MRTHTALLLTSILVLAACEPNKDAPAPPIISPPPSSTKIEGLTDQGKFFVEVKPSPSPIPFQEIFALDVTILDAKRQPLDGVRIDEVRAVMPAHNHGMNVRPEVTSSGDGKFKVDGMRFHMRGDGEDGLWVLEIVVNHEGTIDQTKFEIQCCEIP